MIPPKPPALSCRDDAMAEKVAAAPKLCLSPVEMRTPKAAGGLRPSGTASGPSFSDHVFLGALVKSPRKAIVGQTTSLPPPDGGGFFKQIQGKVWFSILAVL